MKILDPNDPAQRAQIERRWERQSAYPVLLAALFIVAVVVATLVGNQLWYGDWHCAYLNCVRATEVKYLDAGRNVTP